MPTFQELEEQVELQDALLEELLSRETPHLDEMRIRELAREEVRSARNIDIKSPDLLRIEGIFTKIGQASLRTAETTLNVSFAYYGNLHVRLYITDLSASSTPQLRFNDDSGSNYSWVVSTGSTTPTTGNGDTEIHLEETNAATGRYYTFDIVNPITDIKYVNFKGVRGDTAAANPAMIDGGAIWGNIVDPIKSITILTTSGNLDAKSRIEVYGDSKL